MCRRTSYYYNPKLIKCDEGYMIDIYKTKGKKSTLVKCYFDKDYKKVLFMAQVYVRLMTNRQK